MASDSISDHELEGFDPILVSKYFIFVLPYSASIRYLQPNTSATVSFHSVAAIHLSIRRADIDHQKSMAIYKSPYSDAAVQISNSRLKCLESHF
jgi:hypothetical protein